MENPIRCPECGRKREPRTGRVLHIKAGCRLKVDGRKLKQGVPLEVRFWRNVSKSHPKGCWTWTGPVDAYGYGQIGEGSRRRGFRTLKAHRVALQLHGVDVPDNRLVCHHCDVPACVNPAHLYVGTDADNGRDRAGRDRIRFGERHPNAKLTEAVVIEMRRLRASGLRQFEIARYLGLSPQQVSKVIRREHWGRTE